eukprot:2179144-Prymnesium_polylepis.1
MEPARPPFADLRLFRGAVRTAFRERLVDRLDDETWVLCHHLDLIRLRVGEIRINAGRRRLARSSGPRRPAPTSDVPRVPSEISIDDTNLNEARISQFRFRKPGPGGRRRRRGEGNDDRRTPPLCVVERTNATESNRLPASARLDKAVQPYSCRRSYSMSRQNSEDRLARSPPAAPCPCCSSPALESLRRSRVESIPTLLPLRCLAAKLAAL